MVESGTLDLFVLLGPDPKSVIRQYTSLTGVAHMPQVRSVWLKRDNITFLRKFVSSSDMGFGLPSMSLVVLDSRRRQERSG